MKIGKSGAAGIALTIVGALLLGFTFYLAYKVFESYFAKPVPVEFTPMLTVLLMAVIQAMFLGIMGWVSSIMLLRGADFMRVERGVGVVTFKVEKGTGFIKEIEKEGED